MIAKLTGAAAAAVIVATIVFWLVAEIDRRSAPAIEISGPRNNEPIVVEIAGAVASPGVYELRNGDRVVELIDAAGGPYPAGTYSYSADPRNRGEIYILANAGPPGSGETFGQPMMIAVHLPESERR